MFSEGKGRNANLFIERKGFCPRAGHSEWGKNKGQSMAIESWVGFMEEEH